MDIVENYTMQATINNSAIEEEDSVLHDSVMDLLLKDKTTGRNILWATDDYSNYGDMYAAESEIQPCLITDFDTSIIKLRIAKPLTKQNGRVRERAEVFTPSWICNEQNNLVDEQWFGRKNVFNTPSCRAWQVNLENIEFPRNAGKAWKDYIDTKRLEISCGEAPYLVSRYDSVNGNKIDITNRIGLLDRKLRIVNENVDDYSEWMYWLKRAYQSIYGYEFQGDNLLIARKNLLCTFVDNMKHKHGCMPSVDELLDVAEIISWNIWQMDGITCSVPFSENREWSRQLTLFDFMDGRAGRTFCIIKDWITNEIIEYRSLIKE
jgi:hypothetical protein